MSDITTQIACTAEHQSSTEEINRTVETINDISNLSASTANDVTTPDSGITEIKARLNNSASQLRI